MAHYKRRRPRTSPSHNTRWNKWLAKQLPGYDRWGWLRSWPRWHDVVYHTRPRRRRTRVAIVAVMQGRDPDAILWPVEKKPHIYYW